MRLSDWRSEAPTRDAMGQKVMAAIEPVLRSLGCAPDPDCWVAWGDDPGSRYSVLVPTARGLVWCHVRVNVPGEGPRAAGKLVRWPKVQVGEVSIEVAAGHRMMTGQMEGLVLRGVDESAERAVAFMLTVCDAIDGRLTEPAPGRPKRAARSARSPATIRAAGSTRRPAAATTTPRSG
jgi:hypothetical protein